MELVGMEVAFSSPLTARLRLNCSFAAAKV